MRRLNALFVATECAPYCKVGGLGDVVAALPPALREHDVDARVLLPRTAGMDAGPVVARWPDGTLLRRPPDGREDVLLCDAPWLARRRDLYAYGGSAQAADDAHAFATLCRTALNVAADRCGLGWRADVVHCHEWQTAPVALMLLQARVPAASVLTIHNLAHQGVFDVHDTAVLQLPRWAMHSEGAEYWGRVSWLKCGLVYADRLTTVSPGYAREVLTPAFGAGLDGVLRSRADALHGILNGLDDSWDPAFDPALPCAFSAGDLEGKAECRRALERELGMPHDGRPLAAVVARLTPQKGIDLVLDALPALADAGLRLVVLGRGDPELEERLRQAAQRDPAHCVARIGFDDALARRVCAGADLFLMPSRFEPCGLTQMSAMRYGAIPVVNPVGGLADTVADAGDDALPADATGYAMRSPDAAGLADAVRRALRQREDAPRWRRLVGQAMARRFCWRQSAARYVEVYRAALADRGAPLGAQPAAERREPAARAY